MAHEVVYHAADGEHLLKHWSEAIRHIQSPVSDGKMDKSACAYKKKPEDTHARNFHTGPWQNPYEDRHMPDRPSRPA